MKRKIEVSAKKVEDAIAEGLKTLGMTIDEVDVKVLSSGGFLKKAKVEIYYGEDVEEEPAPVAPPVQPKTKAGDQTAEAAISDVKNVEKRAEKDKKEPTAQKNAAAPRKGAQAKAQQPQESGAKKDGSPRQPRGDNAPQEPHWGTPPNFNLEPSTAEGFGKGEATPANERSAAKPNENRRNENRGGQNGQGKPRTEGERNKKKKERASADPTPQQTERAVAFLDGLLRHMGIAAEIETKVEDGLRINLHTEDSRVIGYRGEVLDALQYLASLQVNADSETFVHVSLDGLDYRNKRKGLLENMARRMADKAVRTGRKVTLEPMNSADRRVIHAVLGDSDAVITRSEGHEPGRRVVILPKKQ